MFFSVSCLCLHIYLFFLTILCTCVFSDLSKDCKASSHFVLQELFLRYKGRGERSVEETAGLVGFKLPKQYQDP